MQPKLSPESLWLLCHLNEKSPDGISVINPLPVPGYLKALPKMRHIQGLARRGWALEDGNGIYFITHKGKEAMTKMLTSYRANELWRALRPPPR